MTKPAQYRSYRRMGNLAGFVACAGLIGGAYYLQYVKSVEPCPLCIMQRVAIAAIGLVCLVAALHHPRLIGARIYAGLIGLISLTGVGIAGRHLWLQYLPASMRPSCGPGLEYLVSRFGALEGLRKVLHGSGECGTIHYTIFGLSIPHWTMLAFLIFTAWAVVSALRD